MRTDFEKLLLEESRDAVIATTPAGEVLYWNKGAEIVFGYSADEAMGRHLSDLIASREQPDDDDRIVRDAIQNGYSTYETLSRRKDGSLVFVDVSVKPVRDSNGEIEFILRNKKDVTDLKIQRDVKLVEAHFRDLLDSSPDGIVMANPIGRIVYSNTHANKLFGYERGELLGQVVEQLLPKRYRSNHLVHRGTYLAESQTRLMGAGLELYGQRKDGGEFPVEISLSPLVIGETTLVMSAIRDITDRQDVQTTLHQKNVELQAAISALESFSYSISHDLRTPVRAICGFAGIVLEDYGGLLPAEGQDQLRRIQEGAIKMGQLIDGLLAFSSLGRLPLEKYPVQPSSIVRRVLADLHVEQAGMRVEISVDDLPACEADPILLQQVFVNLLSNALKFSRERNPAIIEIGCQWIDSIPTYFVKDNGAGFDMQYADKIFGVFQRLHRADEFEGNGVGLAIAQRILHRHGGRIWAESQVGKGTTFFFTVLEKDSD